MLLSDRMRAAADLALPCACIADVGCDHGYVAITLVKEKICGRAIALDINKGPLERARENIRAHGLEAYIETRISDGVAALKRGEADGIVCAGMGGRLVVSILERGRELVSEMNQLVLQPQSELAEVRRYLRENGYAIEKEDMVFEDGKYYPMLRAAFAKGRAFETGKASCADAQKTRLEDTYGAFLLQNSHPVLKEYLLWKRAQLTAVRDSLVRADGEKSRRRSEELAEELEDIAFCMEEYFDKNDL